MENYNAVKFVEENIKTIFAYSFARVGNRSDAEDLTSEIILAIIQNGEKIKDPNAFYGFVWGIAANTYKSFIRKKSKFCCQELDENASTDDYVLESICAREDLNRLRRELTLLSKEHRECTVSYYIDGLSCAETAEKLGISLEMVKYYLFKTRKILKEGIGMEREYGIKSYKPSKFYLETIFSGSYNAEYKNLFNRKLPGNIMITSYYTPVTIRELSLELGVASPYLEDEIRLLEKYDLVRKVGEEKYQTNLVIFAEEFDDAFFQKAKTECVNRLKTIYENVKQKLEEIRNIGFIGNTLEDNDLFWALLWFIMRNGNQNFENNNPASSRNDKLYDGATGVNYGVDHEEDADDKYSCLAFAGYCSLEGDYGLSFADFGILPANNRFGMDRASICKNIKEAFENKDNAIIPIFTNEQLNILADMLDPEIKEMGLLYDYLNKTAVNIMLQHAPKQVKPQVEHIIGSTVFFRTVGFIGACAVETGIINIPMHNRPVALYAYKLNNQVNTGDIC